MGRNIVDRPVDWIVEASEAHVALTLVLDVSGSMDGEKINSLNAAVNGMIMQMKEDPRLMNIVDLMILIFGTHGRQNIYQGFRAIAHCESISLEATDVNTYVADALETALDFIRNRCEIYDKAGGSYKPWVVLITDGEFHDGAAALHKIGDRMKQREDRGKLQFFALGVDGYDRSQLEMLTRNPAHIIDAKAANFAEFFSWVGRSLKVVSSKDPGDSVALPTLQFTV